MVQNGSELDFDENKIIVSKTDTSGKITYGNSLFIELSGYSEEELIGKPHNIIRHPQMPKLIFKLLWDYIKVGKEINAYVINLAKSGASYWVFANVTPSFDTNGKIIGYYSVRRKAKKQVIENIIKPLYSKLLDIEKRGGVNEAETYFKNILKEKGLDYDEFILSL